MLRYREPCRRVYSTSALECDAAVHLQSPAVLAVAILLMAAATIGRANRGENAIDILFSACLLMLRCIHTG